MTDDAAILASISGALGHVFTERALLADALTHSSFKHERASQARTDNERLEFLGDAILQWAVSVLLWERFPDASAGEMSRRRADLVCEEGLARIARAIGLGAALRLGRGEERSGGRDKPRLLASALEACVAAVYLDGGRDAAQGVSRRLFADSFTERVPGERDYKTRVQELVQGQGKRVPTYEVESTEGPNHARIYRVAIMVDGQPVARGEGRSKLEAEQAAAAQAVALLLGEEAQSAITER
jgi:ribonuclease-3